jgi:hypothetical protein
MCELTIYMEKASKNIGRIKSPVCLRENGGNVK